MEQRNKPYRVMNTSIRSLSYQDWGDVGWH